MKKNIYRAISCKYPLVSNSNTAKKPDSLSAMICFGSGTPMIRIFTSNSFSTSSNPDNSVRGLSLNPCSDTLKNSAQNQNNTNPGESPRFVLFFARDYFGRISRLKQPVRIYFFGRLRQHSFSRTFLKPSIFFFISLTPAGFQFQRKNTFFSVFLRRGTDHFGKYLDKITLRTE